MIWNNKDCRLKSSVRALEARLSEGLMQKDEMIAVIFIEAINNECCLIDLRLLNCRLKVI
jgi:hypothetical protein